jgi:hypothetical protein
MASAAVTSPMSAHSVLLPNGAGARRCCAWANSAAPQRSDTFTVRWSTACALHRGRQATARLRPSVAADFVALPHQAMTSETVCDRAQSTPELSDIRSRGVAVDRGASSPSVWPCRSSRPLERRSPHCRCVLRAGPTSLPSVMRFGESHARHPGLWRKLGPETW